MNIPNVLIKNTFVELKDFPISKRILDCVGAISAFILFSPIYFIVAFLIIITDGRPVMFRQIRIGRGGNGFYMYKFRSMCIGAEKILQDDPILYNKYVLNDYKFPEGEDPRITRLGHILRKTSLDELPQFWNVFKGEMSLVGPRPIVLDELKEYGSEKNLFLKMKPGITGIWQILGRSNIQYPERVNVELSYLEHQGFWYDIKILFKTIYCVLDRGGAH